MDDVNDGLIDTDSFASLSQAIRSFSIKRDWSNVHAPAQLAKAISVESSELLEVFLWLSDGDEFDVEAARLEVADILIFALLMCDRLDVLPGEIIAKKLAINAARFPL